MITKLKNKTVWVFLFMAMPILVRSQDFPSEDGIDPPPAAPIDDSIVVLWIAAVLFAAYFFYKKNLKIEAK